jgi:folate-binding protein YgfZ
VTTPAEKGRPSRDGAALARLDRGVLEAAGPDRQKFLQNMLTNEVLALRPGDGRPGALLDVKGHVQALLRVLVAKDAVHLEMARDRLEPVKQTLDHYKVAAPVRFQVKATAVLTLFGPEAETVFARAGGEAPVEGAEAHRDTTLDGCAVRVVRAGDLPAQGLVFHVAETDAEAVRLRLIAEGALEATTDSLDALRVEKGRPWYGRDVTEANLLHETGLVTECCSFQKGCYLGQEVVARLDARGGNVNKRLRGLRLQTPTKDGATLTAAGQEVGRVTTAAVSSRLGAIALAYVHRSHAGPGAAVEVDGRPATVVDLPMDDTLPKTA